MVVREEDEDFLSNLWISMINTIFFATAKV